VISRQSSRRPRHAHRLRPRGLGDIKPVATMQDPEGRTGRRAKPYCSPAAVRRFLLLALPSQQLARDTLTAAASDRLIAAHLLEHVAWVSEAGQMEAYPTASKVYCVPHAYGLLDDAWKVLIADMRIDLVELTSISIRELVRELRA